MRGASVRGPTVAWTGRTRGPRQDRRWGRAWSPTQIAHRLVLDFPDDVTMRISPEAIYQALYVQGRGALRQELTACLRTGRALRVPRARTGQTGRHFVSPEVMISERPAEAEDRAVPGHWEGDLIIGLDSSAIGTLVERTTRVTLLLHLPRMAEHAPNNRTTDTKNGPALAGHGAAAVRTAIADAITQLPAHLRRSLTWDQGAEMAEHAALTIATNVAIFFCDPRSPWQRGTNDNTNGLLRQYYPKGTESERPQRRRSGRGRPRAQYASTKITGVEDPCRSTQRALTLHEHNTCCDDWLSPGVLRRSDHCADGASRVTAHAAGRSSASYTVRLGDRADAYARRTAAPTSHGRSILHGVSNLVCPGCAG